MPRKRQAPPRRVLPRFVIVTEGRETEYRYFSGLREEIIGSGTLCDVVVAHSKDKDPLKTLRKARSSLIDGKDRAWAVFDADNVDGSRSEIIRKAFDEAGKGSQAVDCIVSNPCFEFWILLHRKETSRPYLSFSEIEGDLIKAFPELRDERGHFRKNAPGLYALVRTERELACLRARALRSVQADPLVAPFTNVDLLIKTCGSEDSR